MASEKVLELVPDKTLEQIVGLRPGEALGCIHAYECESGCGTSQSCRLCGAVRVILSGLQGCRDMEECHLTRLTQGREESLDLRVLATPFEHDGQRYTLLALEGLPLEAEVVDLGTSGAPPDLTARAGYRYRAAAGLWSCHVQHI